MPANLFFCYAHEDEILLNKLKTHLRPLQRIGLINMWYDRDISAGTDWEREIESHLNTANIILLLVSPDFIDSDYCYSKEMKQALELHDRGEARVIPIILRHILWQKTLLGKLQALPRDGKPVTDPDWYNLDRAFFIVAREIAKVVEELNPELPDFLHETNVKKLNSERTKPVIEAPKQTIEPLEKLDSQQTTPLRRLKVFISYSSHDKPSVHQLYQRLKAYNIDLWLDEVNLIPGQDWEKEISNAVRNTDVVIVCLSHGSFDRAGFLQKEIMFSLEMSLLKPEGTNYIIPLRFENCEIPEGLRPFQWINYFEDNGFDRLIMALEHRRKSLMRS